MLRKYTFVLISACLFCCFFCTGCASLLVNQYNQRGHAVKLQATDGGMIMAADLFAMPSTPGEWISQILAAGVDGFGTYLLIEGVRGLNEDDDSGPVVSDEPTHNDSNRDNKSVTMDVSSGDGSPVTITVNIDSPPTTDNSDNSDNSTEPIIVSP